jgi:radial spoke head protein 4A
VRSLLWPGAYALATPSGFSNLYIGWGVKNAPYSPPSPPEVQIEYEPAEGEAALVESSELPPKPEPEVPESPDGEEGEEGDDDGEEGDEDEDGDEEEEEEEEEEEDE